MICKVCGTDNNEESKFCYQCGHAFGEPFPVETSNEEIPVKTVEPVVISQNTNNTQEKVSTYLVASSIMLAITLLFSCCMGFLGIVVLGLAVTALVFSIQCNTAVKNQDIELAKQHSKKAKIFFYSALGGFFIALIINIAMGILMFLNAIKNSSMSFDELMKPENSEKLKQIIEGYAKNGGKQY